MSEILPFAHSSIRRITYNSQTMKIHYLRLNILKSFPLAKGQAKFLMAVIDYFSKWIEAKPLTIITTHKYNFCF